MRGEEAFSKLYRSFRIPLLRYVRARIHDRHIAEELVQEVFLKAFRKRAAYCRRFAPSTWLWAIAKNTMTDHFRASSALRSGETDASSLALAIDELPSPLKSPETLAIRKEERRRLVGMLRGLTRAQRRVMRLRLVQQLSYEEISRRLGLSLAAVKNLMLRAKGRLAAAC